MMNRAIFKHIEIGEDGDITKTNLTPPYDAISAWQPALGRPTSAVAAQGPAAPQKPQVRPSSGHADHRETRSHESVEVAWRALDAYNGLDVGPQTAPGRVSRRRRRWFTRWPRDQLV